ncbi:MAG: hypothetical protein EVA65_15730 [Oceanococcus sp.]|nr:MAG: hypothetical protein EVA65_15730 [Oceanococcus sp.]
MAATFLDSVAGRIRQIAAIVTSTGAPDADKLVSTGPDGRIDETVLPVGIGADIAEIEMSENLAASDLVNVWNDGGTAKVRKADATAAGKEADGFVLDAGTSGNPAMVYFEGRITGLSGLTPGARYYLDTTAGALTATPPSASNNVVQYIGRAISATELAFEADEGVILA